MDKLELLCIIVGTQNGTATLETLWGFFKKWKIELHDPAIPLLGNYPKDLKSRSQRDINTTAFIAALFTKAKRRKQLTYPLTDEWIRKMWYLHMAEYYSSFKNEVLGAPGWCSRLSVRLQPGHDLAVREFEPRVGLWADGSEPGTCFRICVSLSL